MSPLLVLAAAGAATWVLRVAFVDLLPARKLPQGVRHALEMGGPAAMAALLTTQLIGAAQTATLAPALAGTAAAALASWRWDSLAMTATAGIGGFWAVSALL